MSKYADMTDFVAGKPNWQEMDQHIREYAEFKSENDKRRAEKIPATENDTQLVVDRETLEMYLEAGAELGRLNQAWHDGDRSASMLNQLRLANMAVVAIHKNIQHMLKQHQIRVDIRRKRQETNKLRDIAIVDAAKERRKKKPNFTINAVVDWLRDNNKTTLGKTKTREIIKHLWEKN